MTTAQPTSDLRWLLVLALYIGAILWGITQALMPGPMWDAAFGLLFQMTAAVWAVLDARRLKRPLVHMAQLVIFWFWPIAVPIYLIRTRGLRGLGLAILHALGLFFAMYAPFYAIWIATYGIDAFPPR